MRDRDIPRLAVTAGVFLLLGFVLWHNRANEMLMGALIGAFGTAITFWLGSSKGSADKTEQLEHMAEQASGRPEDPVHMVEGETDGKA